MTVAVACYSMETACERARWNSCERLFTGMQRLSCSCTATTPWTRHAIAIKSRAGVPAAALEAADQQHSFGLGA
jgi:hypothetical protein